MTISQKILKALADDEVVPECTLDAKEKIYSVEWKFRSGAYLFLDISDGEVQIVWKNKNEFFQGSISTDDTDDEPNNGLGDE